MPTEKKDSKPKKAVKKTTKSSKITKAVKKPTKSSKITKAVKKPTKSSKITKAVKAKDLDKVITESIIPNEIIEETIIEQDLIVEENITKEISSDQFLKDFDWDNFEDGIETIKDDKLLEFDKLIEEKFVDTYNESVIEGVIINLTDREAIIDINAKSEGVISLNEFRYNPDLKVGDKVEVLIDIQEDKTGQLILSHRKARTIKAWDRVNEAHDKSTVVNGFVKCRTKGGMIVDIFGLEAFLPGSQIDVKPIRDYDQYVNKNMEFKVVKINHEFKNVVVSHKALIEADIELQKKEIIGQLEKGQVLEGTVKNITTYGVFIDLGGVDGLIHITDLSWNRINHPSEILELDQKLNVVILDFDDDKSRIQLGVKQLSAHPWESLDSELKEGDKIKGKVSVLADYGAFIEVIDGVEGLVHVSEMSWSTHLRSAQDFVKVGDKVDAVILNLDREDRKMSLGIKQLSSDPWTDITNKYPVGSKHSGIVRNFTNFGIFVELEEGVDGLVYISDLSWTVKVKHPSELFATGDSIDVIVLELDSEARKLSLGHKQTKDNPWDVYDKTFAEGTSHNATISDSNDKGATIIFNDDIIAFVPNRHLVKEDGNKLSKGDTTDFKVIEYNKDFKRVVMSHTILFNKEEKKNVKKSLKKVNIKESDKSTLGDLDVLADLKKKMDKKDK
ncbi:MAG: 30S ribosomal protein S1 [Flavobacteriaceae bacterium]|nr:30S ribosomal protein S1 [Flavobacteriaceae bacterium]